MLVTRDILAPPRLAEPSDSVALAHLAAIAFAAKFAHLYPPEVLEGYLRQTYAEPVVAAQIADPALAIWVVPAESRLLAYAMLAPCSLPHAEVTPACIELRRLYTAPDATGAGLGSLLMWDAVLPTFAAAAARGGDAWVGVFEDNQGARRFYARHGFETVGAYEFMVGPVRDRDLILRRRSGEPFQARLREDGA